MAFKSGLQIWPKLFNLLNIYMKLFWISFLELPQMNIGSLTSKRTFFSVLIITLKNALVEKPIAHQNVKPQQVLYLSNKMTM